MTTNESADGDGQLNCLLVVDKGSGPTSHDVVAKVRRAVGIKRVGHAGTLDPLATGVVVVGLGRATRLLRYVQDSTKEYVAQVRFGIGTDSLDADGEETWRQPMPISRDDVLGALPTFRGPIEQTPPMVSAIKIGGQRLHELARAGQEVERQPRPVEIFALELIDFSDGEFPLAVMRVECSKGTYIRVLADDLARSLGGRAHLEGLRRTRVGSFGLGESITVDNLDGWQAATLPAVAAVGSMPRMVVEGDERIRAGNGRPLITTAADGRLAVVDSSGALLAVYVADGGVAKAEMVLL
jgi:tRNA pseudouridine55 synthase